jgi:hypothetical protein
MLSQLSYRPGGHQSTFRSSARGFTAARSRPSSTTITHTSTWQSAIDGSSTAALRALCSHGRDLSVVAEVEQPDQLTQALAACVQLVILIGRSMLRGGGDQQERIRRDLPLARIVVVGVGDERVATAVPTGADGFLARDGDLADQLAAVYGV